MTWLLDSSLLIASVLRHHQQHEDANRWLAKEVNDFATCSVTEGSLIRVHMQLATDKSAEAA